MTKRHGYAEAEARIWREECEELRCQVREASTLSWVGGMGGKPSNESVFGFIGLKELILVSMRETKSQGRLLKLNGIHDHHGLNKGLNRP